jgi:beta-1,4-mannosyltransferase
VRRLTVLHSVRADGPNANQYIPLLLRSVPDDVVTVPFAWRRALFTRYDLFHLHWPEGLIRGATRPAGLAKKLLTGALIARLRLTSTPVVRTLHNTQPHEPPGLVERFQTRLLDRRTATWIRMNGHTTVPRAGRTVTIPHGHYRDWFEGAGPKPAGAAGSLLFFGHIKPYKGVERLLRAFAHLDRPGITLRVVGQPCDEALRSRIESLASQDDRVSVVLRAVDDAALAREIARADLVVLPYEEMHNSGALLLALSLDRPVLVPRNPVNDAVAREVGTGWVGMFEPPLDAAGLSSALDGLECTARTGRPDLSQREWPALGRRLADAYATTTAAP